jgi:serine/threonine-protein kinase
MTESPAGRSLLGPSDVVGRYEVVAELAHGGMAAVLVVRRAGVEGFDKLLAMKVMLPHLAGERKYVDMFLDEARIAAHIQHRNVVQVFDVGEHEGVPHLVMELLRGQALSRIQKKLRPEGRWMKPGHSLAVLAQAADGLHAAHETRGADGAPLHVVHRDVSPHNVHVGYDGQVKVLDFGIAAAAGRISSTRSGEIKGKFSYLAPEQITRSTELDRRVDVWALGVVAWEQLAGRRLFAAKDEGTLLWKVLNEPVPSLRDLTSSIPRAACECVMACLERDPDDRPRTCEEVAEVLWRACDELGDASPRSLGAWMSEEFARDRLLEQERLSAALRRGPPPPIKEPEADSADAVSVEVEAPTRLERPKGRRRPTGLLVSAAALTALGLGALVWAFAGGGEEPLPSESGGAQPPAIGTAPPEPSPEETRAAVEASPPRGEETPAPAAPERPAGGQARAEPTPDVPNETEGDETTRPAAPTAARRRRRGRARRARSPEPQPAAPSADSDQPLLANPY